MPFTTNIESLTNELLDEIKLFYPDFNAQKIEISHSFSAPNCQVIIGEKTFSYQMNPTSKIQSTEDGDEVKLVEDGDEVKSVKNNHPISNCNNSSGTNETEALDAKSKRQIKVFNKLCIYRALSEYTNRQMPWGSLTGIRPTKLAYDMLADGAQLDDVPSLLQERYLVSHPKASLVSQIIRNQSGFLGDAERDILLYVHIPFCKSICSYCAFTAEPVARNRALIQAYTIELIKEIRHAKALIDQMKRRVHAVYIGGGTPTSIDEGQLEDILRELDFGAVEFTCEAGRPDTITQRKIEIMKNHGITRLCINPQTLHDSTLKKIGRSHSSEDFFSSYALARDSQMDINVDLIAGLPDEGNNEFEYTLRQIADLAPQNITVHTLSIKNGAQLKNENYDHDDSNSISSMTDFARVWLDKCGYNPYYLYRQKHMAQNLENIGYAAKNKQCAYNIASMEETLPVVACGAGGISKMLYGGGRIERLANLRDIRLYIEQSDQRLTKKHQFFLTSI